MRCLPSAVVIAAALQATAIGQVPTNGLLLRASFDKTMDADFSQGDGRLFTADSLARANVKPGLGTDAVSWDAAAGRFGGALHFRAQTEQLVFLKGGKNIPYARDGFRGTISMWMRLSPADDLPDGYVDPLQITDKKWNDASLFVDFTDKNPREFRLGVFSDYKFWNPTDRKWDDIPVRERPMISVKKLPFSRDKWTHVVFTWDSFNEDDLGTAILYLDGKARGMLQSKQLFTWDVDDAVIMLGINYVGWIDELLIYDRALSPQEIVGLGA